MITLHSPLIAPAFAGIPSTAFGKVWYVNVGTNPADGAGSSSARQGTTPQNPFSTIDAATAAAVAGRGDVVVIQRGTYSENPTFNKAGVVYVSAIPFGYPDHAIISGTSTVTASNVTFVGLEFFSNSASAASVTINSRAATSDVEQTWFEHCSFASDGTTEPLYGCLLYGGNNHTFNRCYFIDNGQGLAIRSSVTSRPTHVAVWYSQFLENTTYDIGDAAASGESEPSGRDCGSANMVIARNVFGGGETIPADFIRINGTSGAPNRGLVTQNIFAVTSANLAAGVITPTGFVRAANGTEGGWE